MCADAPDVHSIPPNEHARLTQFDRRSLGAKANILPVSATFMLLPHFHVAVTCCSQACINATFWKMTHSQNVPYCLLGILSVFFHRNIQSFVVVGFAGAEYLEDQQSMGCATPDSETHCMVVVPPADETVDQ